MKLLLKWTARVVLILLVAGIVGKAVHTDLRHNNVVSRMSLPSLDSSDPAARVEAARQAAKQYGGKE